MMYFLGIIVLILAPVVIAAVVVCSPFIFFYQVYDRTLKHNELKNGYCQEEEKEEKSGFVNNLFDSYMNAKKDKGL